MSQFNLNLRYKWIVSFAEEMNEVISTSNENLVYSYIELFGLTYTLSDNGIVKCQQLARDLNCMVELGLLNRTSQKNSDTLISRGYPLWSYVYTASSYALESI